MAGAEFTDNPGMPWKIVSETATGNVRVGEPWHFLPRSMAAFAPPGSVRVGAGNALGCEMAICAPQHILIYTERVQNIRIGAALGAGRRSLIAMGSEAMTVTALNILRRD